MSGYTRGREAAVLPDRRPESAVGLTLEASAAHQVRHPGRRVELVLRGAPIVGLWDERRLERVLDNLVGNALKYSPSDTGVCVEVGREDAEDGHWATIRVTDHGPGIPSEHLAHVFQPFWRAPGAATARVHGTGIRLASARQIVEQHGGQIHADSQVGSGSRFVVCLPLTPDWPADDGALPTGLPSRDDGRALHRPACPTWPTDG